MTTRCTWVGTDPLIVAYHDEEWGVPELDSRALFESLVLDGFSAGLSWLTVLHKRERFRAAFADFDPARIARYGARDVARLLRDDGIIRSPPKIAAAIENARAFEAMRSGGHELAALVWCAAADEVGPRDRDRISTEVARSLKALGYRFVGPTLVRAWLRAAGIFNEHEETCFRHHEVAALSPL